MLKYSACIHLQKKNSVQHYNSYRQYLREKTGTPVLKIPLSAGFSCPNRDGTKSKDGCLFCDNRSFSPAALRLEDPLQQLLTIIKKTCGRYTKFIPYLQPFSNTYGSVEKLRQVYEPLLSVDGVIGMAIGTRPDCFTDEIHEYLADLNRRTYLVVEIGLQSSHDVTLERVNRGHTAHDFIKTIEKLDSNGIETVAHVMLGLPGETREMMLETARFCAIQPLRGVKIHQVMIIRDTAFEKMYNKNEIVPMELVSYAELLCDFLEFLRPDQQIHRIMADSKTWHGLIAPLWSTEKSKSLSVIHSIMDARNCIQGSRRTL